MPRAVVDDLELDRVGAVADAHASLGRPGVLEGVRERLLHDAVGREVDARRQVDGLALDVDRDLDRSPDART